MDEATARVLLESMVAANDDPRLEERELEMLVGLARRPDPAGNLPTNRSTATSWAASHPYTAGAVIAAGGRWWRACNSGTSGASAPPWPDLDGLIVTGTHVVDSDVTWVDAGDEWAPTWNLDAAAAHGWRLKAAKASPRFTFSADGQTFNRREVFAHCMQMAAMYERRGGNGSARMRRAD